VTLLDRRIDVPVDVVADLNASVGTVPLDDARISRLNRIDLRAVGRLDVDADVQRAGTKLV
jgi:hypothetical protein